MSFQRGRWAEDKARQYLEEQGFETVAQNYRSPFGEVDLILKRGEELLVFVEVKSLRRNASVRPPALKVGREKRRRIVQTALYYLQEHPWQGQISFDVIEVVGEEPFFRHYPHAFSLDETLPDWA